MMTLTMVTMTRTMTMMRTCTAVESRLARAEAVSFSRTIAWESHHHHHCHCPCHRPCHCHHHHYHDLIISIIFIIISIIIATIIIANKQLNTTILTKPSQFWIVLPFLVRWQNPPWLFWFWLQGCKSRIWIKSDICAMYTILYIIHCSPANIKLACKNFTGLSENIKMPLPVNVRLSRDPEFHLSIFPFHDAAHTHVCNLRLMWSSSWSWFNDDHWVWR